MKSINLFLAVSFMFIYNLSYSQVNTNTLENITSELVAIAQLNVSGKIHSDYQNSGGVAAISCQGNYCHIFAHPDAMASKSINTWVFIMGHELGHFALGHNACGKSGKQAEMDADVYGANLAIKAGYSLTNYTNTLESQPNSCSPSHGCWSERVNNLRRNFGYRTNNKHKCDNWTSYLAFPRK